MSKKPPEVWDPKKSRKNRIQAGVTGIVLVLYGLARLERGILVYQNFQGLDVWSAGVVMLGMVLLLIAFIPRSWVGIFVKAQTRDFEHKHR